MRGLQIFFIAFTFLAPLALWQVHRRAFWQGFHGAACRTLAALLVATEVGELALKIWEEFEVAEDLPMQLCDWALVIAAAALWFRSRRCFEVAYFWGLAGTMQALFTPAVAPDLAAWRFAVFLFIHSGIVVAVLFLTATLHFRPTPASLPRVLWWSEAYLALALVTNALTGGNYGFLSHKPPTASLLDLFSDTPWLYVVQINLTALVFFAVLYAPWWVADRVRLATSTPRDSR